MSHLFLMSARDEESLDRWDGKIWDRIYQTRILNLYFLCQRWMQLAQDARVLDECTVIAATTLGGDFGFSGDVDAPESGAPDRSAEGAVPRVQRSRRKRSISGEGDRLAH